MDPTRIRAASSAAIGVLVLTASGCSSDEPAKKTYAVPESLCGVVVPSDVLEAVLPSADEVTTRASANTFGRKTCLVIADGNIVVTAESEWRAKDLPIVDVVLNTLPLDAEKDVNADGSFAHSKKGGVIKINCASPAKSEYKKKQLFGSVILKDGDWTEGDVRNLVTAYGKGVSESEECTGKGRTA
ncbi:hypothetical protein [Streptomyces sp. NPDC048057]|uniref:hypothetical protein n=1 Tax=Streptomyces sp. NPDC048057 TaxID=3155628 RepID=UPI0033EF2F93